MDKLFELVQPVNGQPIQIAVIAFHSVIAALVVIVLILVIVLMSNTLVTPDKPRGWADKDYDALQGSRKSLVTYMAENKIPDTTPMNRFTVATANFGGIFTEDIRLLSPWIGTVSPEAARLQVEAGARAIVLDIWPDPANSASPVVCSMIDNQAWPIQNIWLKWGLDKGVGRYSNWSLLTRNKMPVEKILTATMTAAFGSSPGTQNRDPFFLILKLHGAMTTSYLDNLGDIVRTAIGGKSMGTEWNKCMNQNVIGTAPVNAFTSKVFVIVVPDIQPGYNSLPSVNTHSGFVTAFLNTRLGEITNALERTAQTIFFEPSGVGAIAAANQTNCENPAGPPQTLAQTSFTVVQPTIGGDTTVNDTLYENSGYVNCMQTGAQFVAVNLFSHKEADGPLTTFFDSQYFGTYSFRKI